MITFDTKPPCAEVDADLFFPVKGGSPRLAKQICQTCSVRAACAREALAGGRTVLGVWGATTEQERRDIRRKQR